MNRFPIEYSNKQITMRKSIITFQHYRLLHKFSNKNKYNEFFTNLESIKLSVETVVVLDVVARYCS